MVPFSRRQPKRGHKELLAKIESNATRLPIQIAKPLERWLCARFMGTKPDVLVAVDTNFVLDLADDDPTAFQCLHALKSKCAPTLVLPNTANVELGRLCIAGEDAETRRLAVKATQLLPTWKISPYPLPGVKTGIVETIADAIRRQGLIPEEERNDSLIVAEAAYLECKLLITSDAHITRADKKELFELLKSKDVTPLIVAHPRFIIERYGNA